MAQLKDTLIQGSARVTDTLYANTFNGLTLTAASTGFTIAGGTTSKTLTVSGTATINAPTQWGIVYGGASGAYTSTAAGTSGQYLKSNGSAAPTWETFSNATVGLGNVENTKLSTWAGSSNITTLGTISSGSIPVTRLTWAGNTNLSPSATANNQEWSIDLPNVTYTGTYWHVWSGKKGATIIGAYNDDQHVTMPGTLESYSTSTGTLQVSGGIGVAKNIYSNGFIRTKGISADTTVTDNVYKPAITLYPSNSNEINFGGYYTANRVVYFGYRKVDDREIPEQYNFGPYSQAIIFVGAVAAGTQKETYLQLGNNKATSEANNGRGRLRLYSVNAYYGDIIPTTLTASRTYTLPDATGTVALTSSNITGTAANVTGTVTVAHGGTGVTSFTNDCVIVATGTTQTLVSRGLKVSGATNADITLEPNTSGKIMTVKLSSTATITYNSTNGCVEIIV